MSENLNTKSNKKPNCYGCKFRGTIPGSAHSCCTVLRTDTNNPDAPTIMLEAQIAAGQLSLVDKTTQEPLIKLTEHGVRNGWADWPLNFDPTWVEACPFETPKETES